VKRAWIAIVLAACGASEDEPCSIPGEGPGVDPSGRFCEQLSSYRLFEDLAAQQPADGVVAYSVNTPLFSDYGQGSLVWLPPGTAMT
jgi:hypothetical protein